MIETPKTPKVSVIIPAFNAANYISRAIDTALQSRGVEVEVIVIDDQSTDETWKVLENYGDAIRKVKQPKGGPYKARNLGASMARGEWLALLDADDEWMPEKLAEQLAVADDKTDFIYTDRLNFGDCDRVKERQSDCVSLYDGEIFEPLLLNNFITLSSVIIRKSAFDKLGGFSETCQGVQDWDLWLRYTASGGRVKLVRTPLTRYRIHTEQMSNSQDSRAAERAAVVQRALDTSRGQKVKRSVARQALANVWQIGAWQSAPSQRWKAIGWYLRAARYWPWNLQPYKGIAKCVLGRV